MAVPETGRLERNLEHAEWRVSFLTSLLQAHRMLTKRNGRWGDKEAEYLERISWAQRELARLRRAAQDGTPVAMAVPPPTVAESRAANGGRRGGA